MAPRAHHFIPVWQTSQIETTYRSREYGPSKKRKRQAVQEDSDDEDASSQPTSPSSEPPSRDRISQSNTDPYRVAGHPQDLPLPDPPFPHAPVKEPRRDARAETAQRNLAALKPPLYVPPAPENQDAKTSLRRHHLSVMTTIMHTALLRRDFARAGRAWGMILRTEVLGRAIDVRTHERWGIGAEILLRQQTELDRESTNESEDDQDDANEITIGREGFRLAKDYYDRLILQFPYQRTHPAAISSTTFYPAMYGLCVYEIQQKYKEALKNAQRASRSPSPLYDQDISDDEDGDGEKKQERRITAVKQSTLDEAIALAVKLDELMLSPPHNTSQPLKQLRAMLALWIYDLCNEVMGSLKKLEPMYRGRANDEHEKATRFFNEVKNSGGEMPEFFSLDD